MTLRNYNNQHKDKMILAEIKECPEFGTQGCDKKKPCKLQDHICPYCGQNLGDGCPLGLFYEKYFISADGSLAICELCERKIKLTSETISKEKENSSKLQIEFCLTFEPDTFLNTTSIEINVNPAFDTYYITELFKKEVHDIIKQIKDTERELF